MTSMSASGNVKIYVKGPAYEIVIPIHSLCCVWSLLPRQQLHYYCTASYCWETYYLRRVDKGLMWLTDPWNDRTLYRLSCVCS